MEARLRFLEQLETHQTISGCSQSSSKLRFDQPEHLTPIQEGSIGTGLGIPNQLQKSGGKGELRHEAKVATAASIDAKRHMTTFAEFVKHDAHVLHQRRVIMIQESQQSHSSAGSKRTLLADLEGETAALQSAQFDVESWPQFDKALKTPRPVPLPLTLESVEKQVGDERLTLQQKPKQSSKPSNLWSALLTPVMGRRQAAKKAVPDPAYILHLAHLCVIDEREDAALAMLHRQLPSLQVLRKNQLHDLVRVIFLKALDKNFDRLALLIVQAGFPKNPLAPIYGPEESRRFPSFFLVALNLGKEAIVQWMLHRIDFKGAPLKNPLNRAWFNSISPLIVAQFCKSGQGSLSLTLALLKTGANPEKAWISYSTYMKCLSFSAANLKASQAKTRRMGKPAKTKTRKSIRSHQEIFRNTKITALDFACAVGKGECAQMLLQALSPESLAESEFSLLMDADLEVALALLKKQPSLIKQRDPRGNTPLHYAARAGRTDLIALYLFFELNVDVLNFYHWTPLHEAAHHGHRATVQYLISRGANCAVVNADGLTALQLARKQGISSEELFDFFHSADTIHRTRALIGDLLDRQLREVAISRRLEHMEGCNDSLSSATDPERTNKAGSRRRFLVERLIRYPKQVFSWRRSSSSTTSLPNT